MEVVGVLLLLLGGLFLFAALTGMPQFILGIEKETPASPAEKAPGTEDHNPADTPPENPPPEASEFEDTPLVPPDEWSTPSEELEIVSDEAPPDTVPEQPPPEIPLPRRISSAALGIVGMAVGILALLDSSL